MVRRGRRSSFSPTEVPALLDAWLQARLWTLKYQTAQDFGSDARPICDTVKTSIDKLGEHLTGDPEVFWRQPATSYPGMPDNVTKK